MKLPTPLPASKLVAAAVIALTCARYPAQSVIDFESFQLGGGLFLDTPDTLVFPNVVGSGVTVTITGHSDLRIYDMTLFGGSGSQGLIDMSWSTFQNAAGTDITFNPPVTSFSLVAGDFGGDDDSPLSIVAFDAQNNVLGTAGASWPGSANIPIPPMAQLTVTANGISRIHYSSGGQFTNSTFIDNLTFTGGSAIPASVLSIGTGCGTPAPTLASTLPILGGMTVISISSAPPSTGGELYLSSVSGSSIPIGSGCFVYLDFATLTPLFPISTNASGAWNVTIGIPGSPALAGLQAEIQGAIFPAPGPLGLALTNALIVTLGV